MNLKSIRLKNIRSFVDERIEFPNGSVLLSGDVGAGKSTVLLAIDFAFFGTRRGELNGSDLLRHGEDHGFVEIAFSVGDKDIIIKRALKRGTGIVQDSGTITINGFKAEYTPMELKAKVLELFGYPKDLLKKSKPIFRYTVYTPQEQMKHILLYPEERLETLRKIFDVEKYGKIRNNAKLFTTELRAMKRELDAFVRDLDSKTKEAEDKRRDKTRAEELLSIKVRALSEIDLRLRKKRTEIDMLKKEIEEMNRTKNEITKRETELRLKRDRSVRIESELKAIQTRILSNEEILRQYEELKEPETSEQEIKSNIDILERKRDGLISQKAVISSEISKLKRIYEKGVCDFCEQSVQDPEAFRFNIEKKLSSSTDADREVEHMDKAIKKLKDEHRNFIAFTAELEKKRQLEKIIAELDNSKGSLENEHSATEDSISSIQKELALLRPRLDVYSELEKRGSLLENELYSVQNEKIAAEKERSRTEQQMSDIEKSLGLLDKEIEEKQKGRAKIERINQLTNWFDSYFINIMLIIEKNVMVAIQKEFNSLFQDWFNMIMGDDLAVRIDDQFSPIIEQNGYETDYNNLSGGEKTSVALAYRLALNKVINSMIDTIKTDDLLILDEPTDGFAAEQLDRIRDIINELGLNQIIIVSHEPKIDTFVDNVIRLSKEHHASRVIS